MRTPTTGGIRLARHFGWFGVFVLPITTMTRQLQYLSCSHSFRDIQKRTFPRTSMVYETIWYLQPFRVGPRLLCTDRTVSNTFSVPNQCVRCSKLTKSKLARVYSEKEQRKEHL
jgi:hypothetical protein